MCTRFMQETSLLPMYTRQIPYSSIGRFELMQPEGISELPFASVSERVLVRSFQTHFHKKSLARGLVLKVRSKSGMAHFHQGPLFAEGFPTPPPPPTLCTETSLVTVEAPSPHPTTPLPLPDIHTYPSLGELIYIS